MGGLPPALLNKTLPAVNPARGQRLRTGTAGHWQGEPRPCSSATNSPARGAEPLAPPELHLFAVKAPAQQQAGQSCWAMRRDGPTAPPACYLLCTENRTTQILFAEHCRALDTGPEGRGGGNSRWFSQNKEKGLFYGTARPHLSQWGRFPGEQGSAHTHVWGYTSSPAALGPALADDTHINKYLTIKYPLIISHTDLWKETGQEGCRYCNACSSAASSPSHEFHSLLMLIGVF